MYFVSFGWLDMAEIELNVNFYMSSIRYTRWGSVRFHRREGC